MGAGFTRAAPSESALRSEGLCAPELEGLQLMRRSLGRPREEMAITVSTAVSGVRACVFDAYGTLLDLASAVEPHAAALGEAARLLLVAAGLLGQLAGNVCFQFALGVVGISLAVQLTLGSMIVFGALLGRIFLHEPISTRMAASMLIF